MTQHPTQKRHTDENIEAWRRDGAVLLPNFLLEEEVAPVVQDFETLYPDSVTGHATPVDLKQDSQIGVFNRDQFTHFDDMPFNTSPALNLIGLHPAFIALAKDALGAEHVHLYQSHTWAKITGRTDYDQNFHCDFKNHTITVPSEDTAQRTINLMIYFTEVTDAHGAIHYVTNGDSDPITGPDRTIFPTDAQQQRLRTKERSGAAPAGSVFAYGIDVYHRGTNLTAPGGRRFTLTASYKAAGNDQIGWSAWPHSFLKPWHLIIDHATPEQLTCLGIPPPGASFWTERTLRRTQERWPNWDLTPYRDAVANN